jgi:hypothetical protein
MLIFYIFTILGSANYFFVGCQGGDGVNIFLKIPHWCLGKKLCNNGEFSLAKNTQQPNDLFQVFSVLIIDHLSSILGSEHNVIFTHPFGSG